MPAKEAGHPHLLLDRASVAQPVDSNETAAFHANRCFSFKATASAPRGAALYEIIERLLRFDPLPYDPALDT